MQRKSTSQAGEKLSSELQSEDDLTILCWCRHFSVSLQRCWGGLYPSPVIPVDSAFICAIWVFVFATRCFCAIFLCLVWGFDGKNKTKQNKFWIFLPQGQLRAQFPAISPYIHQKQCQLWEPVRFPFSPGRWEPWLRCFSLAFGGAPVPSVMLSTRYEALSWEFQDQVVWSLIGPKLHLTWPFS